MKLLSSFLFLIVFSIPLFSQSNWFSDGAEWKYHIQSFNNPDDTISLTKVTGDTIINGEEAKIVTVYLHNETTDYYFHERNDTVFFINQYDNYEWNIAYDFTRNIGDTVFWYYRSGIIEEKGTIDIGGFSRKYLSIDHQPDNDFAPYQWYVEGIGNVGGSLNGNLSCSHIVPYYWFCSPIEYPPRFIFNCYSSLSLNYDPLDICMLSSTRENRTEQKVKIYPNPSLHFLNIDTDFNYSKIEIIDVSGRIQKKINSSQKTISIENFSAGLYFLRLTDEKNVILKKFTVL